MGLALLAGAVTLRMMINVGTDVFAAGMIPNWERFGTLTAAAVTGVSLPEEDTAEKQVWVLHVVPEENPAPPPPTPLTFTAAEAETIEITGKSTYTVDKAALLTSPLEFENTDTPSVLIVHTHTTEAYTQTTGWTYTETDPLRTTENAHSVVRVGAKVKEILESRGISVLHDTAYNDYPDYNSSYANTRKRTEKHLKDNPTIQVVLDLHRDAVVDAAGNPVHETVTLSNGEKSARLMLVVGTDEGGLNHPNWQKNLSLGLKLQAAAARKTPDLFKSVDLRTERFNQHLSPGALLVEVGSAGNTLPEALTAAEELANHLADVLLGV